MDLLTPLPKEETPKDPFEPAWSPAELALHYPEVLHHMVTKLGLSVNARLEGALGGTLLHRAIHQMVSAPLPVAQAYLASLCMLLGAGADASRFDRQESTPLDLAVGCQTRHIEAFGPRCHHKTLGAAIAMLLPKAEPPSMFAGIQADQLSKVNSRGGRVMVGDLLKLSPPANFERL